MCSLCRKFCSLSLSLSLSLSVSLSMECVRLLDTICKKDCINGLTKADLSKITATVHAFTALGSLKDADKFRIQLAHTVVSVSLVELVALLLLLPLPLASLLSPRFPDTCAPDLIWGC